MIKTVSNVEAAFNAAALIRVCEAEPSEVASMYGAVAVECDQPEPDNFYWFADRGSKILAVAHLDTVQSDRTTRVLDTDRGLRVESGALDDRLGAYVIAELLPALGIECDLLFTVGEEKGRSTAAFFDPARHGDREYNWIIEFDRGGTDVVLYQYEDETLRTRIESTGVRVEQGIFSDISFLEHVGVKAMNWGVGYHDYHSMNGYAWLNDTFHMVDAFIEFLNEWSEVRMPHEQRADDAWWLGYRRESGCNEYGGWDYGDYAWEPLDCIEYEVDGDPVYACDPATIVDTEIGPLCQMHRDWYYN